MKRAKPAPTAKARRGANTGSGGAAVIDNARLLGQLSGEAGCVAGVFVAERTAAGIDSGVHEYAIELGGGAAETPRPRKTGARGKRRGGESAAQAGRRLARCCRAVAAVGHPHRVTLIRKLLEGPATYASLQKVTKLKAGPLYHHVTQLRLARLILPKQRDLYELTRGGRNLILALLAVEPLIRDQRRRPISSA